MDEGKGTKMIDLQDPFGGGLQGQSYFHNGIENLFAFFTLILSQMTGGVF